jgi:pimeloyl-ACP methyl ester carboxylesterase
MDVTGPLLFNYIAQYRELIVFDNTGVGHSEGAVPDTVEDMGDYDASLIEALNIDKVVVFGFSLGGGVAQYISWQYTRLVEKAIFAGTSPGTGTGVVGFDPSILQVAAKPGEATEDDMLFLVSRKYQICVQVVTYR